MTTVSKLISVLLGNLRMGQTYDLACEAFKLEVPNVVNQVAKLVAKAAQVCADEANKGNFWKV